MKLKSFGCSFIFGSELSDDGHGQPGATASRLTWPALLAAHMGLDYECHARPGSGNVRIAEQVLNQLASGEPAIYVIGWSWIERFDFIDRNNDHWRTITAWDTDSVAEFYYKEIHSQYSDKLQSLMACALVLQQLQRAGCEFFMTYMDHLIWETDWHHSGAMQLMQAHLRPYLNDFDGDNFLEWSCKHGFPIGIRGKHPLEQAHRAAADHVLARWYTCKRF